MARKLLDNAGQLTAHPRVFTEDLGLRKSGLLGARVGIEYPLQVIDFSSIIVYAFDRIPLHRTQVRLEPPSGLNCPLCKYLYKYANIDILSR